MDGAYSRKLGDRFSGGMAFRFIYSNLTFGQMVGGAETKPGIAAAADVSMYYRNKDIRWGNAKVEFAFGTNISNIGNKMQYSSTSRRDFLPTQIRLGPALTVRTDEYNTVTFCFDAIKLLVPTPPAVDKNNQRIAGKDPNVGVAAGMFQSFYDAPGVEKEPGSGSRSKFTEELREINLCSGFEWWYDKQFALRAGYFHEHATKGYRQYFTFGIGLRYNVFGLDMSYIVPTQARHPLQNTLRFTLLFDFIAVKKDAGPSIE